MNAGSTVQSRPLTVFAAAYVLAGAAALWTAAAIATFFALPQFGRYYSDLRGDRDGGSLIVVLLVIGSVMAVVAAGVCVLLAILTARGLLTARVFTWILIALAGCVAVATLALRPYRAVPWHQGLNTSVAVFTLACLVTVAVLLVLPVSRRYLRAVRDARKLRQAQAQALAARRPPYPPPPRYVLPMPYPGPMPYPPPVGPPHLYPPPPVGPNASLAPPSTPPDQTAPPAQPSTPSDRPGSPTAPPEP